jgi:hypothetical protein
VRFCQLGRDEVGHLAPDHEIGCTPGQGIVSPSPSPKQKNPKKPRWAQPGSGQSHTPGQRWQGRGHCWLRVTCTACTHPLLLPMETTHSLTCHSPTKPQHRAGASSLEPRFQVPECTPRQGLQVCSSFDGSALGSVTDPSQPSWVTVSGSNQPESSKCLVL